MTPHALLAALPALILVACSAPTPAPGPTPLASASPAPAPPSPPPDPSGEATFLLIADLRGVLRPCGCTVDLQKGGFDRLIPLLTSERLTHPAAALLHAGPLFYEAPVVDATKHAQRVRQAEVTAKLLAQAHVTVAGATLTDVLASDGRLGSLAERAQIQLTAANLAIAALPNLPRTAVHRVGTLRVGVFALAGGEELTPVDPLGQPLALPPLAASHVTDPEAAARTAVATLKPQADVIILLSALGLRETKRLVRRVPGIDFAVAGGMGNHPAVSDEAELVGATRVMQFHREGRYLGRLKVKLVDGKTPYIEHNITSKTELAALDQRVERLAQQVAQLPPGDPDLKSVEHHLAAVRDLRDRLAGRSQAPPPSDQSSFSFTLMPVEWDLPEDPDAKALLAAFDAELARINQAAAGSLPTPTPGEAVYVGVDTCLGCHAEVRPFWDTTAHARAWHTLERARKTFDIECVSCHVTGYGRAGGSLIGHTEGREAVQCEACHGPGSLHVATPSVATITAKPSENTCVSCHNRHHSPTFDFATYRARLLVPGHGAPAP